jgi:hypothetical protein
METLARVAGAAYGPGAFTRRTAPAAGPRECRRPTDAEMADIGDGHALAAIAVAWRWLKIPRDMKKKKDRRSSMHRNAVAGMGATSSSAHTK